VYFLIFPTKRVSKLCTFGPKFVQLNAIIQHLMTVMRIQQVFFFILVGCFVAGGWACEERPPVELTTQQRDKIDTMFQRKVNKTLRVELDSMCAKDRDAKIRYLADSIIKARRKEEESLREKYLGQ
jgi:hypothetical protein